MYIMNPFAIALPAKDKLPVRELMNPIFNGPKAGAADIAGLLDEPELPTDAAAKLAGMLVEALTAGAEGLATNAGLDGALERGSVLDEDTGDPVAPRLAVQMAAIATITTALPAARIFQRNGGAVDFGPAEDTGGAASGVHTDN